MARSREGIDTSKPIFLLADEYPIVSVAVIAPKRKTAHAEPEEDSFAEGIIKGLQDFKEGRITRFKDAEGLADYLRGDP